MHPIVVLTSRTSQPPIPRRARPERIKALPAFSALASWLASCVHGRTGEAATVVNLEALEPSWRDRVEEEAVRAVAALDPTAETVARGRSRQLCAVKLAELLAHATDAELSDPDYLQDRATALADLVIDRYRSHLAYGPDGHLTAVQRVTN